MNAKYKKGNIAILIGIISVIGLAVGAIFWKTSLLGKKSELSKTSLSIPRDGDYQIQNSENIFSRTGNITENCHLIYEMPGNPAINVAMVFNEESNCDYGAGSVVCIAAGSGMFCGQSATLEGQITELQNGLPTKVSVTRLTIGSADDDSRTCCMPNQANQLK